MSKKQSTSESTTESTTMQTHHAFSDKYKTKARPLPIRNITYILLAMAALTLVAQFFGFGYIHGIASIAAFVLISLMLLYHSWIDNKRVTYSNFKNAKTVGIAFLIWLPFIILLSPGIYLTIFIDNQIDAGLRYAETSAAGSIVSTERRVEEEIEETIAVPWSWWWPPDYWKSATKKVKTKYLRIVREDVLQPASIWVRSFFSILYSILRVSQLMLYTAIVFILLRSFIFILARSALWNGSKIEFTLP